MNEDDLRKSVSRALRMKEWADGEDGLFQMFDQVQTAYLTTIADSKPGESAEREQLYYRMRALADLRRAMEAVIGKGMNASKIIDELNRKAEKKQRKPPNVA